MASAPGTKVCRELGSNCSYGVVGRASDRSEQGMCERVGKWNNTFTTLPMKGNRERMISGRDLFTRNILFQATENLNRSGIKPSGIYCSMWLKLGGDVI